MQQRASSSDEDFRITILAPDLLSAARTTAIPALSRIAFRVFVSQAASLGFHHCAAGEIFRSDQLNIFALPFFLGLDGVEDFWIDFAQCATGKRCRFNSAGLDWFRKIAHQISGSETGPGCRRKLALFYEGQHTR